MNVLINKILKYPRHKFMVLLFFIAWPLANVINIIPIFKGVELTEEELAEQEEEFRNLKLTTVIKRIIEAGIIGPYLETLVFQLVIFRLVGWIGKDSINTMATSFFTSAILFAAAHILKEKEWYAILIHLPLGISLALIFMVSDINNTRPVLYTTLFHGMWNTVTIALQSIVGKLYYSVKKNNTIL